MHEKLYLIIESYAGKEEVNTRNTESKEEADKLFDMLLESALIIDPWDKEHSYINESRDYAIISDGISATEIHLLEITPEWALSEI